MRSVSWAALVVALCLVLVLPLGAVGTVVVTSAATANGTIVRYTLDWTSNNTGAVSGNAFAVQGRVLQVKFVPDGGSTQPDNLYDVTLNDQDGADVLAGAGANLSNTTASILKLDPPALVDGATATLDLVVAAAGDANGGLVYVWVQR